MIISLNWIKKFTNIDMSIDELSTLIGARLVEIENITDLGAKYKDVIIARIVEVDKVKDSDHLNLTKIDDGGVINDIERDENGFVQVVCGAQNIYVGQLIAWLPPKSIVPDTFNDAEPFILGSRKLRGYMSNGMIASARELDLYDEHDGILEIDLEVAPGSSFSEVYELNDYLLDIENKSLTHRPDCFGIIGFAREIAAISGNEFKSPDLLTNSSEIFGTNNEEINLNITIDDAELCSRYIGVVMSVSVDKKQSPLLIQTYLSRVGVRPINAVVDVTNYLMMLTGQPLHAFDFDKLINLNNNKAEIHVRAGKINEELKLLDGRTIKLTNDDIVITSGETAIGLAGAMGGSSTVIDDNTQRIIIESATFNLYKLRSTQMRHGIYSEAITRFTKGQPAELTSPVLSSAVKLMGEWANAKTLSHSIDIYPVQSMQSIVHITTQNINDILGSNMTSDQILTTLRSVEFEIETNNTDNFIVKAPYWRSDIHIIEDVVEEVGRLTGFDNIIPVLPKRDFTAITSSDFDIFKEKIRSILVKAGSNEVLTYSFIHSDVLQKAGQDISNSYKIINSISPNLQYYRQTLTPNLLNLVHPNIKQGYNNFALFEINKSHKKQDGLTDENVPVESEMMAFVVANKNKQSGTAYYQSKKTFDYLCKLLNIEITYSKMSDDKSNPVNAPFEYRRSAIVVAKKSGINIGIVGEYKKSVTKGFKLPEYISGFEIDLSALFESIQGQNNVYQKISRYPSLERDVCFKVDNNVSYSEIFNAAENSLKNETLNFEISAVDIYQAEGSDTKNITIRIKLTSHDHTLTGDEVKKIIDSVLISVAEKTQAIII